ncbi:MAG TPA: protein kinase, partial [Kofleriaceae bacterium]|nr:protein kinase [Kofleriaceae bacterium]
MVRPAERYRLIERLGAGSIGEVHRALDRATGREVALKLMPRPRGGTNLRDEFVALARLRHPNVVSVLDYGLTDSGHEYFTMELVRGPPLADAVGPPGTRAFYELLAGVLDALAAVHAAGLVHADVKPSNVLVDGGSLATAPDRAARLGDFGLATPLLDPIGPTARGTVGYAAPEAWTGRLDPRSDLYSFGVVLWQLVSGTHPFGGATPRAIVGLQRGGSPDPRRLPPGLPAALTELMTALLDPLPGQRPETAGEVLDRWRAIADSQGHRGVLAGRTPSGRSPRIAIEVGTVLGRDQELFELERAWAEARAGRGSPMLIVGEPGIGKSRLLAELALRIQLDGGDVIRASARAGDEPWAGVRELVRALLATSGAAWDERGLSPARRAALATFLSPGQSRLGPGRWMMAETAAELVAAAATQRPLAILIDDVDAASPAAVDLLAYLARAVPDSAALLVLAGRGLEPSRAPIRSPLDAAVIAAARGRRFELAPLGQSSFFALTRAAVGAELGARLADELRRVSGGNPGHALAALEAMIDGGTLARVGGVWVLSRDAVVPLPAAARQGVMARLAGLAPASRAILRAAATLGDSFDRELLAAIVGDGEAPDDEVEPAAYRAEPMSAGLDVTSADGGPRRDPGTDALEAALADGVASRVLTADPAAGQFRFAHAELADVLGRELPAAAAREYHRRAALTLDRRLATGREVPATVMARHFRAIGDLALASRWSQTAATEATRRGDLAGALVHASDALALATPDQRRDAVRLVADLAARHGDLELALHHFRLAGDGAAPLEQIGLELEIADLERRRGDLAAALDAASRALMRAHRLGDAALAAR